MINYLTEKLNRFTLHIFGQLFLAVILGAIQVFAFAPFHHYWTIYPSLIGFFLLLQQVQKSSKRSFLVSYIYNAAMFLATIHWVYVSMDLFGGMPLLVSLFLIILLAAYLAIFPTISLWASTRLPFLSNPARYILVTPVFWLLADWLRGWFLTGFPWAYLGYSHDETPLAAFAPIFGVQGITLAILIICGAMTLIIKKEKLALNISVITGIIIIATVLQTHQYTTPKPAINVSLVQGNIDQNVKWNAEQLYPSLFKYIDLSNANITQEPELIVWPESAIAALELDMQGFLQPLSRDLAARNKTLISGIIGYQLVNNQYHNTIITLGKLPQGQDYSLTSNNRYEKHQLLPIGEFVPFERFLRPLAPYFNLPMSSFHRGAQVQPNLQTPETSLAAALCYEIAFPELLRKNITEQTGMLVTLSNDAWFGDSIGPAQHLQIARMRALEFARPLLRSTNNGITAIYNSQGKELGRLAPNTAAVLTHKVAPAFGLTPYQSYGSLPLQLYALIILFGLFYKSLKIRNQKNRYAAYKV